MPERPSHEVTEAAYQKFLESLLRGQGVQLDSQEGDRVARGLVGCRLPGLL
jgi:hypothetical protein